MQSRTSLFNTTVLKKDFTRFSPVWGLYSIGLALVLMVLDYSHPALLARDVEGLFHVLSTVNLAYAGIIAVLLFGDLFQARMCNALHAMPLRREGWFLTHLTAGLLFSLIPNTLCALLLGIFLREFFLMALCWLLIMTLQFLFYFGTALLCAMCAGSRFSMLAIYGIFHFIALLALGFWSALYQPLLYGTLFDETLLMRFCPTIAMVEADFVEYSVRYIQTGAFGYDMVYEGSLQGLIWEDMRYLLLCAGVGILSAAGALLLYRRRQLERAGDFLAVKPLSPVFLVIITLGAGILLFGFGALFGMGLSYVFLVLGMIVGFFAARMLLDRTVKVFRPKAFAALGCMMVLLLASLLVTRADPLGVTRYVPENVRSVRIATNSVGSFYEGNSITLEDPEDIQKVLESHKYLIENRDPTSPKNGISIEYTLDDGSTVVRGYYAEKDTPPAKLLQELFNSWDFLFDGLSKEELANSILYAKAELYTSDTTLSLQITQEDFPRLTQAMWEDVQNGRLDQRIRFEGSKELYGWISLEIPYEEGLDRSYYLDIYSDSTACVAFLEELRSRDTP